MSFILELVQPVRKKELRILFYISLAAVAIRVLAIFLFRETLDSSTFEFGKIAQNIVAGEGYSFDFYGQYPNTLTAWIAPFYPYLLAGYYWVFGENLIGMEIVQAGLFGVICLVLGIIAILLFGAEIGLWTAALTAIYPEFIFMPQKYVSEPWLLFWFLLFLLFGILYLKKNKRSYIVLAGIFAGLAALTKESALLYPFIFVVWVWLYKGLTAKRLKDLIVLIVVTFCVIAPWSVRNYTVFDQFVLLRTGFWYNAWRGNHPGATGTARDLDKISVNQVLDEAYRLKLERDLVGNEIARDQVYKRYTLDYILNDIPQYIKLSLRRFVYFWFRDPTHPLTGSVLYWGPWCLVLVLALLGSFASVSYWREFSFWYMIFVITTIIYSLTMVLPRYREPILPGLLILAAVGAQTIKQSLWKKRRE
jgi:4-amino-4-deoxy-L-arabinose transferase-like glycosyltransferase